VNLITPSAFEAAFDDNLTADQTAKMLQIASEIDQKQGVTLAMLRGHSRKRKTVRARWLFFYTARAHDVAFPLMANFLNKDHTTAMNGNAGMIRIINAKSGKEQSDGQ